MTGIIATIVRKARSVAAGLRRAASNPELEPATQHYLIRKAESLESLANAAENGNFAATKAICEEIGLTVEWAEYLREFNHDPNNTEHQLKPHLADDDEDGSGGGMSGGPL